MTPFKRILASRAIAVAVAGSVALVAAGGFTYAQLETPAPRAEPVDWYGFGHHRGEGRGRMSDWRGGPGPGRLGRLCDRDPLRFEGVARAFIKADLDLNTQQAADLDRLGAALVPALKELRTDVCANFAESRPGTAPERLERLAAVLRKAADAAQGAVEPTKSFYAQLDERQKARVEEMAERRRGGGWRDGRGGDRDRWGPGRDGR